VPSVANTYRGMIVDVPLFGANPKAIRETLAEAYADSPIVNLSEIDGDTLAIEHVAGLDRMDLFVFTNGSQTRLTAALDNLGKGASGAAVQSLNLMAGLPETTGLRI
jgi:N-acetyl-gamma-glutamyl-phosphate reductase